MQSHKLLPATALALGLLLAAPGCAHRMGQIDSYNAWRLRCQELDRQYVTRLAEAPYHPMADRGADACSDPTGEHVWLADQSNYHVITANFFYHYDYQVRAKALELLEAYTSNCGEEKTCQDLAQLLDAHLAATSDSQGKAWRTALFPRARALQRKLARLQ